MSWRHGVSTRFTCHSLKQRKTGLGLLDVEISKTNKRRGRFLVFDWFWPMTLLTKVEKSKKPIIFLESIRDSEQIEEHNCLILSKNIIRQHILICFIIFIDKRETKGHTPDTSVPERKESSLSLDLRWCLVEGCFPYIWRDRVMVTHESHKLGYGGSNPPPAILRGRSSVG